MVIVAPHAKAHPSGYWFIIHVDWQARARYRASRIIIRGFDRLMSARRARYFLRQALAAAHRMAAEELLQSGYGLCVLRTNILTTLTTEPGPSETEPSMPRPLSRRSMCSPVHHFQAHEACRTAFDFEEATMFDTIPTYTTTFFGSDRPQTDFRSLIHDAARAKPPVYY